MSTSQNTPLRGREAYEADLRLAPNYHGGAPRPTWEQLSKVARWSWERPAICAYHARNSRTPATTTALNPDTFDANGNQNGSKVSVCQSCADILNAGAYPIEAILAARLGVA